jgi:hemicentin
MGGPNNTFQWEKNGTVAGNDSKLKLMTIDATYGGEYSCIVSNAAGADSAYTTLYVEPYIITPIEKQILVTVDGSGVNVDCPADGFPTPTVKWVDMLNMEVSNRSQLQFNPVSFGDEGLYQCIASVDINGTNFTAVDETTLISKMIKLLQLLRINDSVFCILYTVSPRGSISPQNIITQFGDITTFICSALGGPGNSFQWEGNGELIGNNSMLILEGIDASHGGTYTCIISNAAGNDSISTTLYVAPYIESPLDEQILTANGSNVDIICNAAGFPIPNVMWMDSNDAIISYTSLLLFSPAIFGDEGLYRCVATVGINDETFNATNETTIIGMLLQLVC